MKKWILAALAAVVAWFAFYLYTETNGYPWKRAQIKKDAVRYMQEKYGMDAIASGSSFNFKFDTYSAELYDSRDESKRTVRVERVPYIEGDRYAGERLEDNYGEVYWGIETERRLREAFPEIYGREGVRMIGVDTVYQLSAITEGVGPERDDDGVAIPLKPELEGTWDIDLEEDGFTDPFLEELLRAVRGMEELGLAANLIVTAGRDGPDGQDSAGKTKYLSLEFRRFRDIGSAEDLKALISEY